METTKATLDYTFIDQNDNNININMECYLLTQL